MDFRAMYLRLFNRISDAVYIFQEAQKEGENSYIESKEPNIVSLDILLDDEWEDDN